MSATGFVTSDGLHGGLTEAGLILQAREARWQRRLALAASYACPVATLKLNIPGADKNPPGAFCALGVLRARWLALFTAAGLGLVQEEWDKDSADGAAWHAVLRGNARRVKACGLALEGEGARLDPLARLADADVMDAQGQTLSRADFDLPPRPCLLCERPALVCMREGTHSLAEVQAAIRQILQPFA